MVCDENTLEFKEKEWMMEISGIVKLAGVGAVGAAALGVGTYLGRDFSQHRDMTRRYEEYKQYTDKYLKNRKRELDRQINEAAGVVDWRLEWRSDYSTAVTDLVSEYHLVDSVLRKRKLCVWLEEAQEG